MNFKIAICGHEKTSFPPNWNNRTTTVEVRQPASITSLPNYQAFNEVMRSVLLDVNLLLRLSCRKNEVKIRSLKRSMITLVIFFCSSGFLFASDNTYPTKNRLFHIERSKNKNIVCYDMNMDKTGKPDDKKPLSVYWINREEHPGQHGELSYIQEKLAYGYTVAGKQNGVIIIELNAVKNRKITLERNKQKYICRMEINRKPAELTMIYVKTKSPNSLQVEYVDIHGLDLSTGTSVTERYIP